MPVHYIYLIIAVALETVGTSALQASAQWTRLIPSLIVILAYAGAFYFLGLTLKFMPVGVVYALWSGLGVVMIACIGFVVFGQHLDWPALLGMALIIAGIVVIQVFSRTATH